MVLRVVVQHTIHPEPFSMYEGPYIRRSEWERVWFVRFVFCCWDLSALIPNRQLALSARNASARKHAMYGICLE